MLNPENVPLRKNYKGGQSTPFEGKIHPKIISRGGGQSPQNLNLNLCPDL